MPVLIKAMDPFLRIKKKMGPMLNPQAGRDTALAISKEEPQPNDPPLHPKEREGKRCQNTKSY